MITRGTTPTITFSLPYDTKLFKVIWVTFSQNDKEVFTVETENLSLIGKEVKLTVTQEQTLLLDNDKNVDIQLRVLTQKDNAITSNIIKTSVGRILKEGVISEL